MICNIWSHAISHPGGWWLHGSLGTFKNFIEQHSDTMLHVTWGTLMIEYNTVWELYNYCPGLKCAISRICVYYFIVLNCYLYPMKRSKEKNAFMLQVMPYYIKKK
jgi:hypothetical protein